MTVSVSRSDFGKIVEGRTIVGTSEAAFAGVFDGGDAIAEGELAAIALDAEAFGGAAVGTFRLFAHDTRSKVQRRERSPSFITNR